LHAFKRFENVWSSLRHMQDLHNHVSAFLLLYNSLDYLLWADEADSSGTEIKSLLLAGKKTPLARVRV
jgi:hypothetical protein